jgi:flagellar M-ring protein FliF
MRTIDRLASLEAFSWVRSSAGRLRSSGAVRHPLARLALAAIAVIGVVAVGYLVATSVAPLSPRYLASGRSFSSDDLLEVFRALEEKRIEYRPDDNRRITVSAEQYDQASAVLSKLSIGRRSLGEIRDESSSWSLLETSREKERRELVRREKMLEAMVTKFDDVVWAVVSLRYPQAQSVFQPRGKPSAFVFLETEKDRPLPALTVQSIATCLTAAEPEISPDSITVMDRRGHPYLEVGKPAQGDLSRTRAREEELREEILEKLNKIKGVEVLVSLAPGRADGPGAGGATQTRTDHRPSGVAIGDPAHPHSDRPPTDAKAPSSDIKEPVAARPSRTFIPKIYVNTPPGPLPQQDDARPATTSASSKTDLHDHPGESPAPAVATHGSHPSGAEPVVAPAEGGRVVITVPRSFYYNATITRDDREPTREELSLAASIMEGQIKSKVSLVLHDSPAWKLEIYTNPDDVDLGRRAKLASGSDQRRKALDWGLVGAGAAGVAILVAVASWIQAARAPGRRPEAVRGTRRYHVDSPTAPAPSERVRELVRRNPETAASVLQRWTAQGGGLP